MTSLRWMLMVGCAWVLPSCGLDAGGELVDGAPNPTTDGAQADQKSDAPTSNAVDSSAE